MPWVACDLQNLYVLEVSTVKLCCDNSVQQYYWVGGLGLLYIVQQYRAELPWVTYDRQHFWSQRSEQSYSVVIIECSSITGRMGGVCYRIG